MSAAFAELAASGGRPAHSRPAEPGRPAGPGRPAEAGPAAELAGQRASTAQGRAAWTRPRIPLLPDEQSSPMSRVLLVADSGSGVGAALASTDFLFINVDLAVT